MKARFASFGDFRCGHCHAFVSSAHMLAGVNNRNHCPYCLWSCHLDWFAAGDRLSACKAPMKPIGLTMKKSRNKYRLEQRGELMLVHECTECKALSINRIAADDEPEAIMTVFQESLTTGHQFNALYRDHGIAMLNETHINMVHTQLYGHALATPALEWR